MIESPPAFSHPSSIPQMPSLDPLFLFVLSLICLPPLYLLRKARSRPPSIVLPPGPKPHPFLGHTLQVPKSKAWLYFEQLGKQYGPIVRLSLAGDEIVVLNDPRDAEELLGRRSHNYSSRKPLIYAGKYLSNNKRMVLMHYGPVFKKQRQAFHQMLQPRAVGSYESMQTEEAARLLYYMMTRPTQANLNAKRYSAALVFMMSYGRHLSDDDADLEEVLRILDNFIEDCYPGTHLVDTFPILDSWFVPNIIARWRTQGRKAHDREIQFYLRLLREVKERVDQGDGRLECFAARLWEQYDKLGLDDESLAYVAGSAFEAGTGTTSGMLMFFLMAMVLNPHALRLAQKEIDCIMGPDSESPPTFEHINKLPYCVALCKEVFRWIPAAPGGFPHYSDKDDVYKGYTIKGGTMVIPNIWAMQHDGNVFSKPEVFEPARFLRPPEEAREEHDSLTEGHWAFGFGRRVCPGKYMGAKSVWIAIVQMVWAFDITHALDENGSPIPVDKDNVTSGINIEPKEFAMRITPRSQQHREHIEKLWRNVQAIGSS